MSDKDLFKAYTKLYRAYMKLLSAAKLAFRKLVRVKHEADSTKEMKQLLDAVQEVPDEGKLYEEPKPNGKPTKPKDGSDT